MADGVVVVLGGGSHLAGESAEEGAVRANLPTTDRGGEFVSGTRAKKFTTLARGICDMMVCFSGSPQEEDIPCRDTPTPSIRSRTKPGGSPAPLSPTAPCACTWPMRLAPLRTDGTICARRGNQGRPTVLRELSVICPFWLFALAALRDNTPSPRSFDALAAS
jgi:hypothetical protein